MKTVIYILILLLSIKLTGCCCTKKAKTKAKCHYVTYQEKANYMSRVFSDHLSAKVDIEKYDITKRDEEAKKLEQEFKVAFMNKLYFNGKSGKRSKYLVDYRIQRNLELLKDQKKNNQLWAKANRDSVNNLFSSKYVWIREMEMPYSVFNHLGSPYKNKSVVFYYFTEYNPQTGFGVYYQTNAYYPRDAYALGKDQMGKFDNMEYYCAPFYIEHTRGGVLVNLLSPENDLTERKVFELDLKTGELFKKYEFKVSNDYPFSISSYKLKLIKDYDKYKMAAIESFNKLYEDNSPQLNTAQQTEHNIQSTSDIQNKDYFYPVNIKDTTKVKEGWIYFGKKIIKEGSKLIHIENETMFRNRNVLFLKSNYNQELECFDSTELKKYRLRPFEPLYARDGIKINGGKIIGEVSPGLYYKVTEIDTSTDYIWVKVKIDE